MIDRTSIAARRAGSKRHSLPAISTTLSSMAVVISLALMVTPQSVRAEETATQIHIPQQSLSDALLQLGQQTPLQFVYTTELVRGIPAPSVNGRMTPEEALRQLLAGTGIEYSRTGNTINLWKSGGATQLAPVVVTGTYRAQTEGSQSYAASVATIGKTEQALKDIPQSVTVVTRQRIDDQNLSTISEVLENTTGVTISEVADGGRNFYSRGFQIKNVQYDGVPLSRGFYAVGNSFTGSTAYLDRVEVFRGAQGLFEGAGQPGGSINLVRKRPSAETQVLMEARAGSWDHVGGMLDAGGALNADGSLRARAVLDLDTKGSFVDVVKERNTNLYFALDYDLSPSTTVGVGVLVSRLRSTPFFGGLPRYSDGSSLGFKRSTFLGADWNQWDRDDTQVFADLTHRFNSDWRLNVAATYAKETSLTYMLDATGAVDPATLTGTMRNAWNYDKKAEHVGFDANVNGRFTVLGMPQDLTVGLSMSRLKSEDHIAYANNYLPLDVFHPDPHVPKPDSFPDSQRTSLYEPHVQKGVYAQLRSSLTEDLTLVTGGRFSWFESRFTTQAATWSSVSTSEASAEFTPMLDIMVAG